jgi:hypothetical protein
MKTTELIKLILSLLLGGLLVLLTQAALRHTVRTAEAAIPEKRIFVPFLHMRHIGGEDYVDGGTEVEIWNVDYTRPLTITEIYFAAPDGTKLEGSKYGLPLPLELKPQTHYHFNSFYEYFKLPVPDRSKEKASFVHGYLADIRWQGRTPRVRTWDLGTKNGQYYSMMPGAVFQE